MEEPTPQSKIYAVLAAIPEGYVATYGQVASLAGLPRAARFVGHTLRNLPKNSELPWHRVILGNGRISFPTASAGYEKQIALLQRENILVSNGRIKLPEFQWSAEKNR